MKNFKVVSMLVLTALIFSTSGCNKDKDNASSFDALIKSSGTVGVPLISSDVDTTDVSNNLPIGDATFNCSTVTYSVNAASGGDAGFPLFNPNADIVYPGSMLQGNSLGQASPNPIVVERAGGTISTDILDGNLVSSFEVQEVKKSTITDGINNIIANATGTLPANFNIQIENIESREQFALALGVDVSTAFTEVESKLGYNSESEKSAFMVSMNQSYYTMSFDLPTSLEQLFAPSVTPEQLANYVGPNNPATYISSVTYGRILYVLIESSSSQEELDVAVRGAFTGVTVNVDATLDVNYMSQVDEVTYSVFAYGGDADPSFDIIGATDINTIKNVLKQSTSLGSAKPLSYVVRNVSNNQIVATQLATTYDVVECEQVGTVGTLPAIAHWSNHPLVNELGPITAAYHNGGDEFVLMNNQGKYVVSTINSSGDGEIDGPFVFSNLTLSTVGAACRFRGPGSNLYLFNAQGNKYSVALGNGGWSQIFDISDMYDGECPFVNTGIGAVANAEDNGPNVILPYDENQYMYNKSGQDYVIAGWEQNLSSFIGPTPSNFYENIFTSSTQTDNRIDGVGAAIGYESGNQQVYVLFNLEGTEYVVRADLGSGIETIGPFGL